MMLGLAIVLICSVYIYKRNVQRERGELVDSTRTKFPEAYALCNHPVSAVFSVGKRGCYSFYASVVSGRLTISFVQSSET